jgi:hypothetical protein
VQPLQYRLLITLLGHQQKGNKRGPLEVLWTLSLHILHNSKRVLRRRKENTVSYGLPKEELQNNTECSVDQNDKDLPQSLEAINLVPD